MAGSGRKLSGSSSVYYPHAQINYPLSQVYCPTPQVFALRTSKNVGDDDDDDDDDDDNDDDGDDDVSNGGGDGGDHWNLSSVKRIILTTLWARPCEHLINPTRGAASQIGGLKYAVTIATEPTLKPLGSFERVDSLEQWLQSSEKQAKIAFAMPKVQEGFRLATILTQDCGRQGGKKPCSNINCSQCGFCGNTPAVTSKMDEEPKQKLRQLEVDPVLQRFLSLDRRRIETAQAQADVNIMLSILGLLCCVLQLMYTYTVASDVSIAADALSTTTSTLIGYIEGLHNCIQWSKGSLILRAGKRFTILQSGGSDSMKRKNEQTSTNIIMVPFGAKEGCCVVADSCVSDAEMGEFQVLK
ncbi:hypothetical protein Tco_0345142 [Tanacetum coccineum]